MKTLAALIVFPLLALLFAPVSEARDPESFSEGEIRQLLAPVALYPDGLLSQVLIASTYPLEVVEAARWSRDNPRLEGQAAVDAVADKDWDPNVKALVAFPDLLARMSEELDWTRRLGEAFLLQEDEVIAAVQDLRARAEAAGSLDRLEHARAYRSNDVIVIEPRDTRVVHVPYYSPRIVYGGWGWSAYPPYYWYPPPGYYASTGFWWGGGVVLSSAYFISGFDWGHRHLVILRHHRPHYRHFDSPKWRHDPKHRRGVVYRQPALSRQFARTAPVSAPQSSTTRSVVPKRPAALSRQPGAFYSSGERRTATSDSDRRRTGASTEFRAGSPRAGNPRSEPSRATRGPALSTQRRDATAGTQPSRSREAPREAPRSAQSSRGSETRATAGAANQQRPSFSRGAAAPPSRSLSNASPRPSAGGGDSSRGSALRGMR